jgi:hypothetical protein
VPSITREYTTPVYKDTVNLGCFFFVVRRAKSLSRHSQGQASDDDAGEATAKHADRTRKKGNGKGRSLLSII